MRVVISAGSNINPLVNIPKAIEKITSELQILKISKFYETSAIDASGKEIHDSKFINFAILIETELDPISLKFDILRGIEKSLGRIRSDDKYIPRPIDLDVIYYGDLVIDEDNICIPDPHAIDFAHIAIPVNDIVSEYIHPITGQTMNEIASKFDKELKVIDI